RVPAARDNTIHGLNATTQAADHGYVIRAFDNAYNPASGLSSQAPAGLWRVMFDGQNWAQTSNHWDPRARRPGEAVYNANSLEGFHDDVHGDQIRSFILAPSLQRRPPPCNLAGHQLPRPRLRLVPVRKGLTPGSGALVWWTSDDCRDHLALGYDYPETAAARRSADPVRSLTAWANTQLGWLAPRSPRPADEGARSWLRRQITQPVPAFPAKVLVDVKTPLGAGQAFIGSMATSPRSLATAAAPAALSRPKRILAKAKAAVRSISVRRKGINSIMTTETIAVEESTQEQAQNVLARALPEADIDFKRCYGHLGDLVNQHKVTQWNVTFSVNKFCLDGSFVVYIFLGDFSPEPENWIVEPRLAGASGVFASSRAAIDDGGCANCAKQEAVGLKYMDTVSLTPALLMYWDSQEELYGCQVNDLTPDIVLPFLIRNLHWRVVNINGRQIARETIPSLKVMVYSETVTLPHDVAEAPQFNDRVVHYEVTHGRPGGLNTGEDL
ncbi:tyrosinase, partial [Colletotrichum plurivorum]